MRVIEAVVERLILYSRYLPIVFFVGLAVALAIYAVNFIIEIYDLGRRSVEMARTDLLLGMLVLVDGALVASLGRLDPGSLKIKVATTIVATPRSICCRCS